MLKHIDSDEIGDGKCGIRHPGSQTSDIVEQVEEILRTTCRIDMKTREIYAYVCLHHDGLV